MQNYLTIDVEDYFHVAAFEEVAPYAKWNTYESRVEKNTRDILRVLDRYNIKATFFIVGWVAKRCPDLVREISRLGHEIGCHSYLHRRIYEIGPNGFREDTKKAKDVIEQLTGKPVLGYRAPSYSITKKSLWALDILEELGFVYDSSIFPIYHDLYGIPDAPRFSYTIPGRNLKEYPISTALIFGRKVPVAGGGYFRLFPYWFTKMALKTINEKEKQPFIFYFHPLEIYTDQPPLSNSGWESRLRPKNNNKKNPIRRERVLKDFSFRSIADE